MQQYVIRRLALIPILVFGITLIDFVFINLAPGDPVSAMISPDEMMQMDRDAIEARREALGLNQPIMTRYGIWLKELAQGNLGYSLVKSMPVIDMMWDGLRVTVPLLALSMAITTTLGILLGVVCALRPHTAVDYLLTGWAFAGVGMPSFFFALIIMRVGAVELGWFPTSGLYTPGTDAGLLDRLHHLALPLIALSINDFGSMMRYMRSSLMEVLNDDYVTTARAKGLSSRVVILRHAVRNALLPVVTLVGLSLPSLFAGAVVIEAIFNIPGIGLILVTAMKTNDYPVIMGGILMSGILVLTCNLLADIGYALVDPRIRYA